MGAAPAWLLAKLAPDKSLRGDKDHQWGAQLLREALEKIVASVDLGGGQIFVVDTGIPRPDRLVLTSGVHVDRRPEPAALHEGRHGKKVPRARVAGRRSQPYTAVAARTLR